MDTNKELGLWLLSQRAVTQDQLRRAYDWAAQNPSSDLCAWLVSQALITEDQAQNARAAVTEEARHAAAATRADVSQSAVIDLKELRAGQSFQGYELIAEISRGAMGVVLKAYQEERDRVVAIKFMLTENPDETELKRFQREAETLIRLKHDHIVDIYDFGAENGQCFMVMELLKGQDLSELVDERLLESDAGLSVDEAMRVLRAMAEALQYCHAQGVIHRDFKPQNVYLETREDQDPRPVLIDFGLIKRRKSGDQVESLGQSALTMAGEIVGTPAYMAPEQFGAGGPYGELGPATDVWAWAATLYFLLNSIPPYNKPSMIDIYQAIVLEDCPKLDATRTDIPVWLCELFNQCMEKKAGDRPSFDAILERIDEHCQQAPRRPRALGVLAGLCGLLMAIVALLLWPESSPQLLRPLDWPKYSLRRSLTLQGQLSQAQVRLRVGAVEHHSDSQGQFHFRVPLTEGQNALTFEAFQQGQWRVLDQAQVTCDTKPPVVKIVNDCKRGQLISLSAAQTLNIKIEEASWPVKLEFGGQVLSLEKPEQSLTVEPSESIERRLRVVDRLGHAWETRVRVVTEDSWPGLMARLRDRESWKSASEAVQDAVILRVEERLGPAYEYLKTLQFKGGGQRFRIARFRHVRTGVELHLIPGGKVQVPFWARPDDEYTHQLLTHIVQPEASIELIADAATDSGNEYGGELRKFLSLSEADSDETAIPKIRAQRERLPDLKTQVKAWISKLERESLLLTETLTVAPALVGSFELSCRQWNQVADDKTRLQAKNLDWPLVSRSYTTIETWLAKVGDGFRFPSRREWWQAAQAGTQSRFYWGEDAGLIEDHGWVWKNSRGGLKPVYLHTDKTNAYGLSDTCAHVSEFVQVDWQAWQERLRTMRRDPRIIKRGQELHRNIGLWKTYTFTMGSQSNWWGGWSTSRFFCYRRTSGWSKHVGVRVFVTAPLD